MEFYKLFLKFIETHYPVQFAAFGPHIPPATLFSPALVEIKKSDFEKIKKFIQIVFQLAHTDLYIRALTNEIPLIAQTPCSNYAAFMSYDFHMTSDGPKLIEINTNASLSSYSSMLSEFQSAHLGKNYLGVHFFENCKQTLLHERGESSSAPIVAITDENPENQKAYSEFLFYRSLFQQWGWTAEIIDTQNLVFDTESQKLRSETNIFDLVYNRNTDFYFESPSTQALKKSYLAQAVSLTPHPREYGLLADKQRLLNLSNSEFLKSINVSDSDIALIESVIPKIKPISEFNRLTSKKERENYFFKPQRSFGGKAVYRGRSLSQKTFEDILFKPYLAQELIEPPAISVETEDGKKDFKWDLRVYTYKDQPQILIARLFQGQMTNTNTLGGGLAPVVMS